MAKTYEAMQKKSISVHDRARWQFLNLKNKKQTGGLEKKILHFKKKYNHKIFNFSSSRGKEGVSTILSNLLNYTKLHRSEKNVLVIDANLQRPCLHKVFNISNQTGLSDALNETKSIEDISIPIDSTNITLIPSGKGYRALSGSLEESSLSEILNECKNKYDLIFIDSAAVLASSDALTTALSADATFLVVQSLKIPKEVALKAKTLLQDNECILGGVVLNDVQQVIPRWIYKIF